MSTKVSAGSQARSELARPGLAIEARGLCKAFGRTRVLRDLALEVAWGQVLTILGPNGSGKTTLIKALATLTKPDAGVIRVAGLDPARAGQTVRRVIGVVTHDSLLYDDLTGYENLKFYARMFSLDRTDQRIAGAVERMGMTDRLDQRVATMSHGMKKRFSIARALLHDPLVLLMDEPESGLDHEAVLMLQDVVSDPSAPSRAVVMTTHNLEWAVSLRQSIAFLGGGRLTYRGSPDTPGAAVEDSYLRSTCAVQQ